MSVIKRARGGQEYLYFQYYREGRKVERYIGPSKAHETWDQWKRIRDEYKSSISDWLQKQVSELDETIAITLGLDRRRLLEAEIKPPLEAPKIEIPSIIAPRPSSRPIKSSRGKKRTGKVKKK